METRQTVELHPNSLTDKFEVIGHVPRLMALWLTKFLKRPTNRAKVIVKGKRVNRAGGFGLEVHASISLKVTVFLVVGCNGN